MEAGRKYIVCVDDEGFILNTLGAQLRSRFGTDYSYEFCEGGIEAFEVIDGIYERGDEVYLVISDQIMPEMSGDEFLYELHLRHPDVVNILLTGQASIEVAANIVNNAGLFRFLAKPWSEEDLLLSVAQGLRKRNLVEQGKRRLDMFRKFVPIEFIETLDIDEDYDLSGLKPKVINCSVAFLDVQSFSSMIATNPPAKVLNFLNLLYDEITQDIVHYGGFIDKFIGDGLMIIFPCSASQTMEALLKIFERLREFNASHLSQGMNEAKIRIGMSTGQVVMGLIGNNKRMDSSVFGYTVNLAARIENAARDYGADFVISEDTYRSLDDSIKQKIELRRLDLARLRGIKERVNLYEVLSIGNSALVQKKIDSRKLFEKALADMDKKDYASALAGLIKCLNIAPDDNAARVLARKAHRLRLQSANKKA